MIPATPASPVRELVGRASDLETLRAAANEAAGALRLCLVSGPPGIGKTALVRAVLASFTSIQTRWATGDQDEKNFSYGILDQLGLPTRVQPGVPAPDLFATGSLLVEALSDGNAGPRFCIVIDDAQWADQLSLRALSFALRRLRADPVLVVVICRDDGLDQLPEGLRRLADDTGKHVQVAGLLTEDLMKLSAIMGAAPLSRAAAERLRTHTAGNPLYAMTLIGELDGNQLESYPGELLPAPHSFSKLIAARMDRCSRDTRELVGAASVLGQQCPLPIAIRLADLPDASSALEEAVGEGFISITPSDHHISFVHPLIRAAVYHGLPTGQRMQLHGQAAGLVEGESAALRHRVAATIGGDDGLAKEAASLAERHVLSGNWVQAAETFGAAASLATEDTERERCALHRIDALLLQGGVAEATASADDVRRFSPTPLRDFVLSEIALFRGAHAEALELLRRAWDNCRRPDDDQLAGRVANQLAHLAINACHGEETVAWARKARALTHGGMAPDATTLLCLGLGVLGRAHEGLAEVGVLAASSQDPQVPQVDALVGWGILQLWTDDLTGSQVSLGRAEALLARQGPLQQRLVALLYLADAEYRAGRWGDAVVHSQLAVSLAHDADQAWTFALTHAVATFPLAAQGMWEAAEGHAAAAAEAAAALRDGASTIWAAMAAARLEHARENFEAVRDALKPIPDLVDVDGLQEAGIQPWQSLLVDALIGLRRYDEAEPILAAVAAHAQDRAHPTESVRAHHLRGLLLAANGNLSEAEDVFAAAHQVDPDRRSPLEAARLTVDHGSVLRRSGKRRAAATLLNNGCQILAELGARPYLEIAEREAIACGVARRSTHLGIRGQLTPQENAVATLVVSGMTNRQAATQLVVSEKAIEYHLGNIYSKLGINSRSLLVARLLSAPTPK